MAEGNGKRELPVATLETLEEILAADDTNSAGVLVPVPEWNCSFKVRGLTRGEVLAMTDMDGSAREAFMLATGTVAPQISGEKALALVTEKGFSPTQAVLDKIMEVSGLTDTFRQAGEEDDVREGAAD